MLQSIHDKSKGWLAYLIVGFISIPFMLWGINSYLGGGDQLLAAEVNGEEISLQSFQRSLQTQRERLREMFGGNVPAEMLEGAAIKQTVVEGMIRDELLRQFAEDQNFQISDRQVSSEIQALPVFQENGRFSTEKYTQLLESRRMNKTGFESDIRYGMRLQQFRNSVQTSEFLTPVEYETFKSLGNQKREIAYSVIEVTALEGDVQVSDDQVVEYYGSHQDEFLSEERIKLDYVALDPESVVDAIKVTENEVRDFYEQESDRFKTAEARSVSHILLKSKDGESAEAIASKAALISQRLGDGEAFSDVVKDVSEDVLTADKGGDLGLIYPGDLDPDLEKVIFSSEVGVPSAPVTTAQGVQFVLVTEIEASTQKTFDDVRADAELELKQRQADTQLLALSEQLLTLTYENPESLDIAADAIGVKVQTLDWMTREQGAGLAEQAKIREAGFSDDVLKSQRNSDVLELEDGRQIVVRVTSHEAASTLPLETVKAQVKMKLLAKATREKSLELGQALAKSVEGGAALQEVSTGVSGSRFVEKISVARSSEDHSREVVGHAFKMDQPNEAKATVSSFQMANGDYVVVELHSVNSESNDEDEAVIQQATSILSDAYAQRAFDSIYRSMAARAEIKVFNENL